MLFHALALPLDGGEVRRLAARVAAAVCARAGPAFAPRVRSARGGRIRVGVVSPDFRLHPGAFLLRRLLRDFDRDRFEFFCYALNRDDGSPIRAELARSATRFAEVDPLGSREIASLIRDEGVDVLLDKSGYLAGTRPEVLALRPAPVQIEYLGTGCTLGPGLADYRLSDAWTTPAEAQRDWFERLLLIPPPHFVFDSELPCGPAGKRTEYGLPEHGLVLCAMHQPFKLDPQVFAIWMRLLARAPTSVLWMMDPGELARGHLLAFARECGIGAERIVFAPRIDYQRHLGRLAHADLLLDTFGCGALSTALEALWTGVPVLTRAGSTLVSRLAATFVRSAGLKGFVTESVEAYERAAQALIDDPARLSAARSALLQARASCPLFDTTSRVRAIERAIAVVHARWLDGLPPATLSVD